MADLSDVMTALVNLAAAAVYPNGTGQASVAGVDIRVLPGWPDPATLQTDLAAGKVTVSVYPLPAERNTTRYPNEWQDGTINVAKLTLTVSGNTVTVGGTIQSGESAVVTVNGTSYSYGVLTNDTLNTVAAAIAALIAGASAVNAVVTIPSAHSLTATVVVQGTAVREVKRQDRQFQVTVWAPDFTKRDTVAKYVDVALGDTERMTMPDNSSARLIYMHSPMTDNLEKQGIYRRDLIYSVEYATMATLTTSTVQAPVVNITEGPTGQITITAPTLNSSQL